MLPAWTADMGAEQLQAPPSPDCSPVPERINSFILHVRLSPLGGHRMLGVGDVPCPLCWTRTFVLGCLPPFRL